LSSVFLSLTHKKLIGSGSGIGDYWVAVLLKKALFGLAAKNSLLT
jgi:hypothetical protein